MFQHLAVSVKWHLWKYSLASNGINLSYAFHALISSFDMARSTLSDFHEYDYPNCQWHKQKELRSYFKILKDQVCSMCFHVKSYTLKSRLSFLSFLDISVWSYGEYWQAIKHRCAHLHYSWRVNMSWFKVCPSWQTGKKKTKKVPTP